MPDLLDIGRKTLASQPFSQFLGAELVSLEPGRAVLALNVRAEYHQQHGFVHGGVISYLVDNSITFAGGSVLGENVVTAKFKVKYLSPARGDRVKAVAEVKSIRPKLAVCKCELYSLEAGESTLCAQGEGTVVLLK
jgi:uncharacterized protein (TIGR00369 family)